MELDLIFGSLADPTRRDILQRLMKVALTVGRIAEHYDLTFAAISKHLKVLEKAKLVTKKRQGREQIVQIHPRALKEANAYLRQYEKMWNERFDRLEKYLASSPSHHDKR